MKRWKTLAGVVLLFALGFLSGLTFSHLALSDLGGPPPDRVLRFIEGRIKGELDLTEEQQAILEESIQEAQQELEQLHKEIFPRLESIFHRAQEKLLPALNEEQKKKLEELNRQEQERFERHRPPPSE